MIVAIAVVVALVVTAAVAIPLVLKSQREERERLAAEELQRQQTAEADEVAEAYLTELAAHEEVWSDEAVVALHGADVAGSLALIDLDSSALSLGATVLAGACESQEAIVESFEVLQGSTRPTLADVPGSSEDYQRAQEAVQRNDGLAEAEQALLTEGLDLATDVRDHCRAWAGASSSIGHITSELAEERQAVLVPEGGSQTEGNWRIDCEDEAGCLPLQRSDREAYADLTVAAHQDWLELKTEVFSSACLPGYEDFCEAEIARAQAELDSASEAMDLLRGPLSDGDDALPGYNDAVDDWNDMIDQFREENDDLLRAIDDAIEARGGGLFAGHQGHVVEGWESQVAELAEATRPMSVTDQA